MTLDQLRMLVAVAETGTLKLASDVLHKTQPAVSQGIAKLEASLGVTLFSRQQYRLTLTSQGYRLFQHAKTVLSEAEQLHQLADHYASGYETEITLAFEATFDLSYVLPALEQTQSAFPDTRITLKQHFISGAIQALENDEADLAISPIIERIRVSNRFKMQSIYVGKLITVASQQLISRHPDLSVIEELQNEYQIVIKDTGTETKGIDLGVQDRQRRWYVNDFSIKKMLIMSGMGWGSLPEYLIKTELETGQLREINLESIPTRKNDIPYFSLRKKDKLLGPVSTYFWECLL